MQNGRKQSADDDGENGEIVVRAVILNAGTGSSQAHAAEFRSDTLGVSQYGESGSDSDSSSEGQAHVTKVSEHAGDEPNRPRDIPHANGQPPRERKRVRFADDVKFSSEPPAKALRLSPYERNSQGIAHIADGDELDEEMTRFESILGLTKSREEADLELAEAEDAREEAFQQELQERVERLRQNLQAKRISKTNRNENNDRPDKPSGLNPGMGASGEEQVPEKLLAQQGDVDLENRAQS